MTDPAVIDAPVDPATLLDETFAAILAGAYGSGRREDYDALDQVTTRTFQWRLGAEFGSDRLPMTSLVNELRNRLVEAGSEACYKAIAAFYQALPGDRELRAWVARRATRLAGLVSEEDFVAAERAMQARRVRTVSAALDRVRVAAVDGGVAALIRQAREDLAAVAGNLARLSACKGVHDTLHGLQTGAYAELLPLLTREGPLDEEEALKVEFQIPALESAEVRLETNLQLLSEDGDWLEDLRGAIAALNATPTDRRRTQLGIRVLRSVLRQQLPAYDKRILEAAADIPFGRVVGFLRQDEMKSQFIAAFESELVPAARDLEVLERAMARSRGLHERWQKVDAVLWDLEQAAQSPADEGELVRFQWESATRRLDALKEAAPDMWDVNLDTARGLVATSLAQPGLPGLVSALNRFVRIARLQFLKVDKGVLEQCIRIDALRPPIQALLEVR